MLYSYGIYFLDDNLFVMFITGGILTLVIPISIIILLITSIKNIKKRTYMMESLLCITILFVTILMHQFLPPSYIKLRIDFKKNLGRWNEVIKKIRENELQTLDEQFTSLPKDYFGLSVDNKVCCLINDNSRLLVAFLYKKGFPDEDQYLFYSSNGEALIKEKVDKDYYQYIEKIVDNWYFVQFN